MKKQISGLLLLLLIAVSGSTCKKKISSYPFDMEGIWYSPDAFCSKVLVIGNNGDGKLLSSEDALMCTGFEGNVKGKVKYRKDILYIGSKKYEIMNGPKVVTTNDSIEAPDEKDPTGRATGKKKVLAKMTLEKKGIVSFSETYHFYKYVDY